MSIIRSFVSSPKRYEQSWETDGGSLTTRISLSWLDFAVGATTANYDIGNIPGGFLIEDAWVVVRQNFTGGAVSAATMSVGSTGSPTIYVLATSVFSGAPVYIGQANAQKGAAFTSPATAFVNTALPPAVGTVRVQLVTTTANANALTAGKADLFMRMLATSVRT